MSEPGTRAVIPVRPEYAVAVLRWAAGRQEPGPGGYQRAFEEVLPLVSDGPGCIAKDLVLAALRRHVPAPGTLIHGKSRGPGNTMTRGRHWAAGEAVALARQPGAACAWAWTAGSPGDDWHDLRVITADGVTTRFSATCPQRQAVTSPGLRDALLAEIARCQDGSASGAAPDEAPGREA
jgi:hypothetical protein